MRHAVPSPLRHRGFRLFFAGQSVSLVGDAMAPVAWPFAVLHGVGGPTDVGVVLAAGSVTLVALLLVGGVVADRLGQRRVMLVADLVRVATEGTVAALLLTGQASVLSLALLAAGWGAGAAFFNPAATGLLPQLVPPAALHEANALRSLASSLSAAAGPALAGTLVALAGPGWAFAVNAASFVVSAACLSALRVEPAAERAGSTLLADLREGWREFASRRWLWSIVVQFSLWHLLAYAPVLVLGAVIAEQRLGGAAAWAAITACLGVGAVLGSLASLRLRPARPLVAATLGAVCFAPFIAGLAGGAPTGALCTFATLGGAGFAVFGTVWETALQRHVPPGALSRVSAYDWFGSLALMPVGLAIAAPLGSLLGYAGTLWLGTAYVVVSAAVVLALPEVRALRTDPDPPAPELTPRPQLRPAS